MLNQSSDDYVIDARDFSKFQRELPLKPSARVTLNATLLTIEKGLKDLSTRITTAPTGARIGNPATLYSGSAASTASPITSSNVLNEKNLPPDGRVRLKTKMNRTKIRLSKDRVRYKNNLTICSTDGLQQSRNFVEFPLSTKTFLFRLDGSMFQHLKFQDNSQRKAFFANMTPLHALPTIDWYIWCLITKA